MKSIINILILLFSINISFACINDHKKILSIKLMEKSSNNSPQKKWEKKINQSALEKLADELLDQYNEKNIVEDLSDHAVALIYLGDFIKAKNIYHQIEKEQPELYTTASNLGTIYELIGKPDSALIWIQKSIDINPDSHGGSEWVHIKILEFKINGKEDYSKSILGFDFGDEIQANSEMNATELAKLQHHLEHQLEERGNFVKPKNLIAGSIYNDLGDIMLLQEKLDGAIDMYTNAKEYGFESDLMNKRLGSLISDEPRSFFAANFGWIILLASLGIFAFMGLLFWKRN